MLLTNDRSTNELPPLHDPFNNFNLAYDATQKSNVLNISRKDLLKKLHNGFDISSFTDTSILLLIISGPTALLALRVHNISILLALEAKQVTSVTFADISKAFDTVWVKALLYKPKHRYLMKISYTSLKRNLNFNSKIFSIIHIPIYIICLINFMKKIHLHKSYIKYLRRYVSRQNKSK
jgi:hypothetical protein